MLGILKHVKNQSQFSCAKISQTLSKYVQANQYLLRVFTEQAESIK